MNLHIKNNQQFILLKYEWSSSGHVLYGWSSFSRSNMELGGNFRKQVPIEGSGTILGRLVKTSSSFYILFVKNNSHFLFYHSSYIYLVYSHNYAYFLSGLLNKWSLMIVSLFLFLRFWAFILKFIAEFLLLWFSMEFFFIQIKWIYMWILISSMRMVRFANLILALYLLILLLSLFTIMLS